MLWPLWPLCAATTEAEFPCAGQAFPNPVKGKVDNIQISELTGKQVVAWPNFTNKILRFRHIKLLTLKQSIKYDAYQSRTCSTCVDA